MRKYKSILSISILLGSIILGGFLSGCSINNKKTEQKIISAEDILQKQQEYIFSKNQECLKDKDSLEKKLLNKESPFGTTSLEQIFYSPKQNSCLYVEYSYRESAEFGYCYNRRLFDILNDGDSAHPLEACTSVCPSLNLDKRTGGITNDCIGLDSKIEEYKK